MAAIKLSSPIGICRVVIVILGLIILVLGIVSHFTSSWIRYCAGSNCQSLYQICDDEKTVLPEGITQCPKIIIENFFIGVIIFCFLLSALGLIASLLKEMGEGILKLIDFGYHVISALLLLTGGILYIISAEQIHNIYGFDKELLFNFKRPEKLAAGSLAILQGLIYGLTAFLIVKN